MNAHCLFRLPLAGVSPVRGYGDAVGQCEVNQVGRVGIDAHIASLRHVPAVGLPPVFAPIVTDPDAVEGGGVDRVAVPGMKRKGAERRVVDAEVAPLAGLVEFEESVHRLDA